MYARTAAFDAAVKVSHVVITTADLLLDGKVIATNLLVTGGGVDVDGTANVRRRCSLSLINRQGLLTGASASALSPYGRELRIYRGIKYANGTIEKLPIGTFRIAKVSAADSGDSQQVTVSGFDRSRAVSRARFESPYAIAAGVNYVTAIQALLTSRLPAVDLAHWNTAITTATTPLLVFDQGADPWESATRMADSIGCLLYFDPMGVCQLVPVTEDVTVAWDYVKGSKAVVISVDNEQSDEPGYNGVVVDGEPADLPPVRAVVYDTDPASPTRADGPYGKVPRFYRSQFITSEPQATAAATGLLAQERGATESLKFSAVPHPAHEVGDLVHVADAAIGVDGNYYLEAFNIPCGLDVMTCTTRKRRVA